MDLLQPIEKTRAVGSPNILENEALLLEYERGFQVMADFCPQLMWMAKADGWIYWYNRHWYEYTGASVSDLEGWGWQSVHDPEQLPQIMTQWQASIDTGEPFEMTFPLKGADGFFREFLTRIVPVKDKNGKVLRWFGTNTDISEQKKTENQLNDFFDTASIGLHWVGPDGIILRANQAELALLGYTAEDYVGQHIAQFHTDEAVINDILARLIQDEKLINYEARLRCKDGSIRHVLISSSVYRENGEFIHTRCFTKDITELKQTEKTLNESEEQFRMMATSTPLLIAFTDSEGRAVYYNQSWLTYTGKTLEELLDKGWVDCLHPEERDAFVSGFMRAKEKQERFEREYRLRRHDGVYQWFLVVAMPRFAAGGQFKGYIGTNTNIHALKAVQQEYEALFTHAKEGIFIVDDDGQYLKVNPAGCEKLGLTQEEIVGRTISEVFFASQPEAFTEMWSHFLREGSLVGELAYSAPDGREVEFEYASVAHYVPERHLSVLRDITERKAAQSALRESEARFRSMADSAPLFIWMSGPDGQTSYVNKTWTEFLGLPARDCIEYGMRDCMLPDEKKQAVEAYRMAFSKKESYTIECRMKRHDGELRWILSKGMPLLFPEGGLAGYMGTSIDITDRKEAEVHLGKSLVREQLIRRVMELIGKSFDIDNILQTVAEELGRFFGADRSGVTRYCFNNGELSFNLSAQYTREGCKPVDPKDIEIITNAFQKLSPETFANEQEQIVNIPDQASYIEHMRLGMAARFPEGLPGISTEQLIEIVLKYDIQSSLRVNIFYRGVPYGSLSVSQCTYNREWQQDEVELLKTIAEHAGSAIYQAELYKQAQETAEKEQLSRREIEVYAKNLELSNRELEQFATIASHDLKEPLRKIQVFGEIVQETVPEESKEYLARMRNAASRMQTLIDDLLTLSRVSRKGKSFEMVNLDHSIKGVLDDLQVTIQESKAQISVGSLGNVYGDESQIRQLLQNLVGNSLKYRAENVAPVIQIYGSVSPNNRDYQITVEDNGIGLDARHSTRIFEPFQRLHEVGKYPGTGMGLAICHKIAERHNGAITVESKIGQGSKFTFTLPKC
jgi:PAS domain S-box-containing protein